ncbi:MAG: aminotransferase class I/II-fold pyridoxal phosphate-dependent enzyme [Thermoplasmata archaeon]
MEVYHGGAREGEDKYLDFSYSSNPYAPKFLKNAIKSASFDRYPYCESTLEKQIKKRFEIGGEVVIGAGVTELLNMASYLFKGKTAVMLKSTYGEYARIAKLFDMKIRYVTNPDPELEDLKLHNEVLYFSNPNNPTGKYYRFLKELAEYSAKKNSYVIVDEAFIDFVEKPVKEYRENMIILRSFTKSYNIAGIRTGYAITEPGIASQLRMFRMPWSIGALGCSVVRAIVEDSEYLSTTLPKIERERKRVETRLNLKTDANYFIADVKNAAGVTEKLKKKNMLVRNCSSFGLDCCIRFSIKRKNENSMLLDELEQFEPKIPRWLRI